MRRRLTNARHPRGEPRRGQLICTAQVLRISFPCEHPHLIHELDLEEPLAKGVGSTGVYPLLRGTVAFSGFLVPRVITDWNTPLTAAGSGTGSDVMRTIFLGAARRVSTDHPAEGDAATP